MRRPDVRGNEYGLWAGFQRHFQKIAAIQPENGPSVRVDVANALQARGKALRSLKGWQEDDIMHLARAAVFFVNGADFSAQDKAGFARGFAGQAQVFFQRKHAFARRLQRFGKFLTPGGMRKIPRTQQAHALASGPQVEMRSIALPAGGAGKAGMNVQIGNQHLYLTKNAGSALPAANPEITSLRQRQTARGLLATYDFMRRIFPSAACANRSVFPEHSHGSKIGIMRKTRTFFAGNTEGIASEGAHIAQRPLKTSATRPRNRAPAQLKTCRAGRANGRRAPENRLPSGRDFAKQQKPR